MRAFARKRPALVGVIAGVLTAAGTALAAFLIYSGIDGSGGGKVAAGQTVGALTFTAGTLSSTDEVSPGTPGRVRFLVTNNDPNHTITIASIAVQSIVADNGCNTSGLSVDVSNLVSTPFAIGATNVPAQSVITAANNLDPACAGATLTVNVTGTTTAS